MKTMLAGIVSLLLLASITSTVTRADESSTKNGWINMFDGKTLNGWKVSKENADSIKVEDGAIVTHGKPAHVYFETDQPFVDFEFETDVLTKPKSNSGIYFHTKYQDGGWPKYGYEAQVNATHADPKKSGSLYAVENVMKAPHEDNKWFKYNIRVEGRHIVMKIDDQVVLDYTEPEGKKPGEDFTRVVDKGTIALQAHDPDSKVMYKNLRIRRLK